MMRFHLALLMVALAGCSQQPASNSAAVEKRYPLRGEIVSLDAKNQVATIKHENIEGWMDAMTMDFPIRDKADFDRLKPGDRIEGTVIVRDIDYTVAEIRIVEAPPRDEPAERPSK
jgi:protein SCO1/2